MSGEKDANAVVIDVAVVYVLFIDVAVVYLLLIVFFLKQSETESS